MSDENEYIPDPDDDNAYDPTRGGEEVTEHEDDGEDTGED